MDHSDAELMRDWQRGDDGAFAVLVARWQGPMARFLAHLAGPEAPVHDLCQEVFLRLLDAGPRYRENGAFAPGFIALRSMWPATPAVGAANSRSHS